MSAPAADHVLDALRTALESSGWRCTPQRAAVYGQLCRVDHHPTAEELYRGVRGEIPNISLATVYKSLEAMVACGLVTKLSAGDGSARYDARSDHHYHLRDLRTGVVHDLTTPYDPDLVDKLDPDLRWQLAARGFRATGYRLELVGYFEGSRPVTEAEADDDQDDGGRNGDSNGGPEADGT
jgi:Fur family peroxide stress response transcriptional regulator